MIDLPEVGNVIVGIRIITIAEVNLAITFIPAVKIKYAPTFSGGSKTQLGLGQTAETGLRSWTVTKSCGLESHRGIKVEKIKIIERAG